MSFVDTNVLVHAATPLAPSHDRALQALTRLQGQGHVAISRQILRELLSVLTRPQPWGAANRMADALTTIAGFMRVFTILDDGPEVWNRLTELAGQFNFGGKQVHDANIVATMLAHRETRLLTFNGADFRRFAPLIEIIEP